MRSEGAFTARAISRVKLDRLYRVHVSGKELFFIKVGGQGIESLAVHFGLLGALLFGGWKKRADAKLQERLSAHCNSDLRALLASDSANFQLSSAGVLRSSLEAPHWFVGHGAHVGRWLFEDTRRNKHTLQFESLPEMHEAVRILPGILGACLTVNAAWDGAASAYVKRAEVGRS